ncbi:MAG: ribonuclease III [Oscillospiraceae bacterium]
MLSELEAGLGYTFRDKSILENALTHSSYANENRERGLHDNERLEFLGDSILGFVVADYLYRSFPDKPEGELTRIRADLVCEKNLARAAATIRLGSFLLLGHGEEHGGGRKRDSIVSDAMESVIAASYMDGGFSAAKEIIDRLILCDVPAGKPHNFDYKTALQELVQRKKDQVLRYELIGESGPDHDKKFDVEVLLNGKPCGKGTGSSKNAPSRPPPQPPSTRCSRENCKKRNKTGCLPAARSLCGNALFQLRDLLAVHADDGLQKRDLILQLFHAVLGASVSSKSCWPSARRLIFGPISLSRMTLKIWAIS